MTLPLQVDAWIPLNVRSLTHTRRRVQCLISSLLSDHTPYLSEKDHQFAPPPITRFLTFQRIGLLNHGLHGKSGELPPWPDARKRLPFPKYGYIENLFPTAMGFESSILGSRVRRLTKAPPLSRPH